MNTHHNLPPEGHDLAQTLRDMLPADITKAISCVSFAIFDDGPEEPSDGLFITSLSLLMCRVAANDAKPGSLDEFKALFRQNSDPRISESQINSMVTLCTQPRAIETAEKRNELLLIMPDGSIDYSVGHFKLQLEANSWLLVGSDDFRIGDLPSAMRCAHLLASGKAPETFAAQFQVAKVPTSQLLFPGQPALERFNLAYQADPTPSVLLLCKWCMPPTYIDAQPLSRGLLGHLKALQQYQEKLDHAALALALETHCSSPQPITPVHIETLLAFCAAAESESEAAVVDEQNLYLILSPSGKLNLPVANSMLEKIKGDWHVLTPRSAPQPSLAAALRLADAIAPYVKDQVFTD